MQNWPIYDRKIITVTILNLKTKPVHENEVLTLLYSAMTKPI